MKTEDSNNRRVAYLVERLKEDALGEGEIEEIRDIIRNQPCACRRFVELLYLSADLRVVVGNWQEQVDGQNGSIVIGRFLWRAASGLAAVAVVTLMVLWLWAKSPRGAEGDFSSAGHSDAGGIAVVSQTSGVEWGEGTSLSVEKLERGAPVGAGVLEIVSGLAQVDFYSGATVILEGPTWIKLETPDLVRLEYGNLWAHVPPPARGFRVETSGFKVVDLGTEFVMKVDREGHGEVHVLDGEVEVHSKTSNGQKENLLTGEGLNLAVDGTTSEIEARADSFDAAERLSRSARKNFQRWQAFHQELCGDPDMLVAYDFQDNCPHGLTVRNVAAASSQDTNGAVVGCRRAEGRWAGKGALEFRNASHRVRTNVLSTFENLTLACWVRVDRLNSRTTSLLYSEADDQKRSVNWSLVKVDGQSIHLHFRDTTGGSSNILDQRHYHCDRNILKDSSLGSWMHVAVTYDSKAGRVTHYLNGEVIGINEEENPRLLGIGIADIGNWSYQVWAEGTEFEVRNLNGAIDEFLIMRRAARPEQIAAMFAAGSP